MAFLEKHYKVCKDIDSRPAEMPEKDNREGKSTTLLGKIKPYSVVFQLNCLYDTKFNE